MAGQFGYFWDKRLTQRDPGPLCPESLKRAQVLAPANIFESLSDVALPELMPCDPRLLTLVHDSDYVGRVEKAHANSRLYLDSGDTRVTPDIFEQSLLSASAGLAAVDEVLQDRLSKVFCAVRPPGHHANRHRALGFCVFNNAALTARYAQSNYGVGKVLIVDWDVHVGNGTQEIFWQDPTVFTLSFHQADLFPESARPDLIGEGAGRGFNRNVAFAPRTTSEVYLAAFDETVRQVAASFKPQLILISAGFDACHRDPASKLVIADADFAAMTRTVLGIADEFAGGRIISLLEGGYNTASLRDSVRHHCAALLSG